MKLKPGSKRREIFDGKIVKLGIETAQLPDGRETDLEVVRHPGGAAIVAVDEADRVCLIKQFRHAAGGWIWELPAGVRDDAEPAEQTARRELKEETGLNAADWQSLGSLLSTPGFCDERLFLYLAQALTQGEHAREDNEFIEVHWLTMDQSMQMVASGEIEDAKTVIGLFKAQVALAKNASLETETG